MRILVAVSSFYMAHAGGAEVQAFMLAEEWARQGAEVHLVPLEYTGNGVREHGGVRVHDLGAPVDTVSGRRALRRLLGAVRPDVCYVRVLKYLRIVTPVCRAAGVPVLFNLYSAEQCHRQWRPSLGNGWRSLLVYVRKSLRDEINKCWFRGAAAIVAQTVEQQEALQMNYGLRAHVLPNGHPVPEGPFSKDDPPVVLWIGKDWKGPEAFAALADRLHDLPARFEMIGTLPAALSAELSRRPRANLHAWGPLPLEAVHRRLAAASIYVNTSPMEGFPNTFLEAWMRNSAVVSLTVDPDGVLARGGLGLRSGSVDALAADVRRLLSDEDARRALTLRARLHACARHALPLVAGRYLSLFEELCVAGVLSPQRRREMPGPPLRLCGERTPSPRSTHGGETT